ncbi:MAG: polyphosphate kinase [Pseudomonadota bacterium]|nr:polyphosphate kinase [Pseudomonadota bacterium]
MTPLRLADIDLGQRIADKEYESRLADLQKQLRAVELAYRRFGVRGIIVFEGWDAAGKGGTIRRLTAQLDPRGFEVWPIAAPGPEYRGRHYLERFWARLPGPGKIAIFDRSWYGRVLVERVEGLVPPADWERGYEEIVAFEHMLSRDGVRLVKLFLHVSAETQEKRFRERLEDPWKRWKLTVDDFRNSARRADYEAAIDEMLRRTSTDETPWHLIASEDKQAGRIAALETIVRVLGDGLDLGPPPLDPEVERLIGERLGPGGRKKD